MFSGLPPGFKLTEEILNAEKPTLPPPPAIHYTEKHVRCFHSTQNSEWLCLVFPNASLCVSSSVSDWIRWLRSVWPICPSHHGGILQVHTGIQYRIGLLSKHKLWQGDRRDTVTHLGWAAGVWWGSGVWPQGRPQSQPSLNNHRDIWPG